MSNATPQRIVLHLWFDTEARDAAVFYTELFSKRSTSGPSRVEQVTPLTGTPSGETDMVSFSLCGYSFTAISAGPLFAPNPSISFMLNFDPSVDTDASPLLHTFWDALFKGGKVLLPLSAYPWSEQYGWVEDRYGVSWQLALTDPAFEPPPFIMPALLFTGDRSSKAEEATELYLSTFRNAPGSNASETRRGALLRYPKESEPGMEGRIMYTDVALLGQWFAAMDGAPIHDFAFSEGISLMVRCDTQEEIDHYWSAFSAVPEAEQCGWLKDAYGVSWQIVPAALERMLTGPNPEKVDRVTRAFLDMKKLDIDKLDTAYQGA